MFEDSPVNPKSDSTLPWGHLPLADSDEKLALLKVNGAMDILLQRITQQLRNVVKQAVCAKA